MSDPLPARRVPAAATWGLIAAFAVHDLEELATMPAWTARQAEWLRERYPTLPERIVSTLEVSPTHAAVSIGLMGLLVGAAAADGARTGGRSVAYQTVLAGFGLHAVSHLAQSAAFRGYTPGVITAPIVVAPFSVWAWRQLRRAGVLKQTDTATIVASAAMFPVAIVTVHAAAYGVRRLARWIVGGGVG